MWTSDGVIRIARPNQCIVLEGLIARNKLTCVEYELPIHEECGGWLTSSLEDLPPGDYVIQYDTDVGAINSHYGDVKFYPPCPEDEAP